MGLLYVSIPHRYAKNLLPLTDPCKESTVSIPHRYAKNYFCRLLRIWMVQFQFLIGTLKTFTNPPYSLAEKSFNSS